jgi:hypothetical protein
MWTRIRQALTPDGVFVGPLFGLRDVGPALPA